MAFMAALEADLRALSAEARRRHPAVKDAAEHAILKLRLLSSSSEIAQNEDILQMFLMACNVKSVKLSVIGLSCLQKLISHNAVASSALKELLSCLKDHAEMTEESVQLKTLQTILIIFQSRLHPENEEDMAQALGICLHLLENNRSSDSVRNTASATFRQAVALIFANVVSAESLPSGKVQPNSTSLLASSVADNVSRSFSRSMPEDDSGQISSRESLTKTGKIGLSLLDDLTSLAAGVSASWLNVRSLHRAFALDILEFILSTHIAVFQALSPYQQVLKNRICSLLMTSLRTNVELEGEAGEPTFRRLVLRLVAHIIRLYNSLLVTESEVFLNMLVKVTRLDLPLWHQILVIEILRGFCVEARTLCLLFQNFDMNPLNTNIVENMVRALALVVSSIQGSDSSEETLAAVAGMFSSRAKGIEWSMDNDVSNAAVLVASEAHCITLAIEGLLGVVFTIASLTDEAVDAGELQTPKSDSETVECTGKTALLCVAMINSTWLTILDSLSLVLTRSQGEDIILEILKGYQAFTQACGILHVTESLNSFLASLCKFTISIPVEGDKRSILSPGSRKLESLPDLRESIVLTPKNVQALRTLFNVAHRLHNVLGTSWILVLETLAALDRAIHSPHASTQEVSSAAKLTRDTSGQYSDFHILSSLNSQLFESSALMNISAVKSLLTALHQLSSLQLSAMSQTTAQQIGSIAFSVQRMTSILMSNLHRVAHIWDQIASNLLELAECPSPQLRNMALDALDSSICTVVGSEGFPVVCSVSDQSPGSTIGGEDEVQSFECEVLSPLVALSTSNKNLDIRLGSLKILLHVLERHGEKLYYCWPGILHMLRTVADAPEKDVISLGFQSVRVIMNEGLSTIPVQFLNESVEVTGAYATQTTDINISLTAIGLLWTAIDFIAKGVINNVPEETGSLDQADGHSAESIRTNTNEPTSTFSSDGSTGKSTMKLMVDYNKLLFLVFSILQKLGADGRPEVRNSAIRTLFQTLSSHGQKISRSMWEDCLWIYVFPILDRVSDLAANSSKDEWQGKELGTQGGKAVHMLIHHSRNTAQKQWDETIVLVLGGIARLLRSYFSFLRELNNFSSGWELLLDFVKNGISTGSKEVALAALSCLQTIASSNCPKGLIERSHVKSMLDVYELVAQTSPNYKNDSVDKVKQEILHGLGGLYVQAQSMFDDGMYLRLIAILHLIIKCSKTYSDYESESNSITSVQRTLLEIVPLLCPTDALATMWSPLLHELLCYLNGYEDPQSCQKNDVYKDEPQTNGVVQNIPGAEPSYDGGGTSINDVTPSSWNMAFVEKLLPHIVQVYLKSPSVEKCNAAPEIVQGLGRCMNTRRDHPRGSIWRISVEYFHRIVTEETRREVAEYKNEKFSFKLVRARFWKEVADAYEIFLLGSCGHVFSSDVLSAEELRSEELIEMTVINVLGESVIKGQSDAPIEVLQRLVTTLDRCASRTGSLPLESVVLVPPHCTRFSLNCLQMMFSLCSSDPTQSSNLFGRVGRIAIPILLTRCEIILNQFLSDENGLGDCPLPDIRIQETLFVLKELARMVLLRNAADGLPLPLYLKDALMQNNSFEHAHLLVLLPSFSELVVSREARVRELMQVLLRLISSDLGLRRLTS